MPNKLVMIIRHAEKPIQGGPDLGVTEQGESDPASLTVRGWQRAGGLCRFFYEPPLPLGRPASIVASGTIKRDDSGTRSKRPSQTITPLARRLGLEPDVTHSKGQEQLAADAIRTAQSPVLVSWQHESIPALAAALVGGTGIAPQSWPDDDFDSIWVLEADQANVWSFSRERQALLDGDDTGQMS
ncbi:histidine phosphatase family protein [Mesorhizobium sp. AR07]|uniref:histidine phosphatase family protein n=1 Tax=Mesorhizobium sp. AR07 TaxID=2865838 RepID=UPI002160CA1A|nr:histidine phosphatase family protein [Mesorhizobium sp. AR07]UVK46284.1 histidine phosphatase family protein [Mesorhizobium sp. AR07]